MSKNVKIEICSPAGSWESLAAAIKAGADSVYFGAGKLNMRAHSAANFAKKDIPGIVEKCSKNKIKAYLALNSIIYDDEFDEAVSYCEAARKYGVSAVILQDIALAKFAKSIGLSVHFSVQANISNFPTIKMLSEFGDTFVLARELTLEQIAKIAKKIKTEKILSPSGEAPRLELFIHGAMCVAVSGTCGMSLVSYGKSAQRGECYQNCRRAYRVIDEETGQEFIIDNHYVMSPKDLCCIRIIDRIMDSGVSVLKIEGRARSPEYVYHTTKVYSEAVKRVQEGKFDANFAKEAEKELERVFNRGFWYGGYYLGDRTGEWCGISGPKTTLKKVYAGKITNYFPKVSCAEAELQSERLSAGDQVIITGATTGVCSFKLSSLRIDDKETISAPKKSKPTFFVPEKVRRGDRIYILSSQG